jgi:LacI family transcriptional regulator
MPDRKRVLVALRLSDFNLTGMLKGLQSYLLTHPNLSARFCLLAPEMGTTVHMLQTMNARTHPDGVLTSAFLGRSELRLDAGTPLVNLNSDLPSEYPSVWPDQKRAGQMVAEHLLEQDIPHYAFASLGRHYYAKLRWEGFHGRLLQAGHTCHKLDDFIHSRRDRPVTDDELCAWVAQLTKPVGIHAVEMAMAMRILWASQELRLRVPEDLALVGGQDTPALAMAWDPQLTAVDLDFAHVGYECLRLLDRLMRGKPPPVAPMLLPPKGIVARPSSDVRGTRDPEVARIRQLIREQAHRPLAVKELLARTPFSRGTLEQRFEKHLGHSLHAEIVLAHMERAQRLLRETLMPVTQVAALSGYANYAVFSVAFRKHTGMTALAYRQREVTAEGI